MPRVQRLIHEELLALRTTKKLSRSQLSRATVREGFAGVPESTIEALEKNPGQMPAAATIKALADVLGVDPDHFYEWPIAAAKAARVPKPSVVRRAKAAAQRLDDTQSTSPQTDSAQGDEGP